MQVEIDTTEFTKAMARYEAKFELEKPKVLREQMRLFIAKIRDFLPPKKRSEGVNAINKDITKQFVDANVVIDTFQGKNADITNNFKKYVRTKAYDKLQTLCDRTGLLRGIEVKEFNTADIKRNDHGRIIQSGRKILPLNRKALMDYKKELWGRVGNLLGSLKDAYAKVGGKFPAWIKSNSSYSFTDKTTDKNQPYIEFVSKVPYAGNVDQRYNVVQKAMKARIRDIMASIDKGLLNKAQKAFYGKE